MPLSPVPISAFPDATLPLNGSELMPLVQSGETVKTTVAAAVSAALFGPEYSIVGAAGNNNNVPVAGNRLLVDTTAGDAVITGVDATGIATGYPLIILNRGPNLLTLAVQNAASLIGNRLYGITDMALPPFGSMMLVRSGTLLRWTITS